MNKYSTSPFHITNRCHNRQQFELPMKDVWQIVTDNLNFTRFAFSLHVHAFVLMPNHFHLIVSAPNHNLSEAMFYFLRQSTRIINFETGNINQLWGNRFYRCELSTYHYYLNAYKYVYQNPLRARLSGTVHGYQFSTLRYLLGGGVIPFPIDDSILFDGSVERNLEWLNRRPNDGYTESIRKALRRSQFKLPKVDSRPHPLEFNVL